MKNGSESVYITSVYLDILKSGTDMYPETLLPLIEHCSRKNKSLIISMDSNAHSVLWGPDSNHRGEAIEDLLLTYGLTLENRGFTPTFLARGTQTHIDITLSLNCSLEDWQVTDEVTLSDHQLIRFNLQSSPTPVHKSLIWGKLTGSNSLNV